MPYTGGVSWGQLLARRLLIALFGALAVTVAVSQGVFDVGEQLLPRYISGSPTPIEQARVVPATDPAAHIAVLITVISIAAGLCGLLTGRAQVVLSVVVWAYALFWLGVWRWLEGVVVWPWANYQLVITVEPVSLPLLPVLAALSFQGLWLYAEYQWRVRWHLPPGHQKIRCLLRAALSELEPGLRVLRAPARCGHGAPADMLAVDAQWQLVLLEIEPAPGQGIVEHELLRHYSWLREHEAALRRRFKLGSAAAGLRPRVMVLAQRGSEIISVRPLMFFQDIVVDIVSFSLVRLSGGWQTVIWKRNSSHYSGAEARSAVVVPTPLVSDPLEYQEAGVAEISAEELTGLID